MSLITSEIVENFVNNGHFDIDDAGPLHAPFCDLKINRDEKLKLIVTTTSDMDAKSKSTDHPPGTVRINNDSIEMTGKRRLTLEIIHEVVFTLKSKSINSIWLAQVMIKVLLE